MKKRKCTDDNDVGDKIQEWNKHLETKLMPEHIPVDMTKLIEEYADWSGWINQKFQYVYSLTSSDHTDCYKRAGTEFKNHGIYRYCIEPCKISIVENLNRLFEDSNEDDQPIKMFLKVFNSDLKMKSNIEMTNDRFYKLVNRIKTKITDEDVLYDMMEHLVEVIDALPGEFTDSASGTCYKVEKILLN